VTTRAGAQILQRLDELRTEWGVDMPDSEFDAVLVKALLVHGAAWGEAADVLRRTLQAAQMSAGREDLQRALGYGAIRPRWPLSDDNHRVTAIFASRWSDGVHEYRLPLPPSPAGQTAWRRLSVTLAWLTPVNTSHRGYRRAALRIDPAGPNALADKRQQASNNAVNPERSSINSSTVTERFRMLTTPSTRLSSRAVRQRAHLMSRCRTPWPSRSKRHKKSASRSTLR
jgi:hypothetical protein